MVGAVVTAFRESYFLKRHALILQYANKVFAEKAFFIFKRRVCETMFPAPPSKFGLSDLRASQKGEKIPRKQNNHLYFSRYRPWAARPLRGIFGAVRAGRGGPNRFPGKFFFKRHALKRPFPGPLCRTSASEGNDQGWPV